MLERLVENWLTKINEKSFQLPFCQLLTAEGYKILHLSRHGSFEEGKDILAIAKDGTPCAFQLKGSPSGKISQNEWSKYNAQITRLVETPIKHPGIDENLPRRVFFVTNGELEEEVRLEILHQNSDRKRRGHPELEVIVKGELLRRFFDLQDDLWPTKLSFEKEMLELYLSDGHGYLDKPKLTTFLEGLLFQGGLKQVEITRKMASAAIFTSYALSPYSALENHVALVEGWTIFLSCMISLAEKAKLSPRIWNDQAEIVLHAIDYYLEDLCVELAQSKNFVTGDPLVDAPFYRARFTWILSLLCTLMIMKKRENPKWDPEEWMVRFVLDNQNQLELWGEGSVPQLLAVIWWFDIMQYEHLAGRLLFAITKGIVDINNKGNGLIDPYHPLAKVVMIKQGIGEQDPHNIYKNRSYVLEGLIELLVRRGWRGALAEIWRPLTSIHYARFDPERTYQYSLWHCEEGIMQTSFPQSPQSWANLVIQSSTHNINNIPKYLQKNPEFLLLFLIVYPHRLQTDVMKFLDSVFNKAK